jgi:hypothetical protein
LNIYIISLRIILWRLNVNVIKLKMIVKNKCFLFRLKSSIFYHLIICYIVILFILCSNLKFYLKNVFRNQITWDYLFNCTSISTKNNWKKTYSSDSIALISVSVLISVLVSVSVLVSLIDSIGCEVIGFWAIFPSVSYLTIGCCFTCCNCGPFSDCRQSSVILLLFC